MFYEVFFRDPVNRIKYSVKFFSDKTLESFREILNFAVRNRIIENYERDFAKAFISYQSILKFEEKS